VLSSPAFLGASDYNLKTNKKHLQQGHPSFSITGPHDKKFMCVCVCVCVCVCDAACIRALHHINSLLKTMKKHNMLANKKHVTQKTY